jgi:hypothetical protein
MKTFISTLVTLLILLPSLAFSQRRPDRFTIGQYNFEINLPSRPDSVERADFKLLDYHVYGETFEWNGDQTVTLGIYQPLKIGDQLTESSKTNIITAYAKLLRTDLQKENLATSESPGRQLDRKKGLFRRPETFESWET